MTGIPRTRGDRIAAIYPAGAPEKQRVPEEQVSTREGGKEMERKKAVQRAEMVLMFIGIIAVLLGLLLEDDSTGGPQKPSISDVRDLDEATFAVMVASSYEKMVPILFPKAKMNVVSGWDEECLQVIQGKSDAVLWERSSLDEALDAYPQIMALGDPIEKLTFGWATRKTPEGQALCEEINAFVRTLRESGELDEIYKRWENPEKAPDHVDFDFAPESGKRKLRFASCLDWQPICYENNGNACGYMIELLARFCASAGYTPVPEYVDIQSMLAGLGTGRYDLLCYGFDHWSESEDEANFTDVMMEDDVYVLIAKDRYAGAETTVSRKKAGLAERFAEGIKTISEKFEKNFIRENRWQMILRGLRTTLLLSICSVAFGTLLGGLICFMHRSSSPILEAIARIYVRLIQGTPIVLLLLILYYVVFGKSSVSAFWVCVLGFTLDFAAYAGEIFRSGIGAVPSGQTKAAVALGFGRFEAFTQVVFPQMVIHCLPVYIGQVISTVKLTSVAGYISVQDLTRVTDMIRARTYEAFFPLIFTALVYFCIAWLLMQCLRVLEKRVDPAKRKRIVRGVKMRDQG